MEFKPSTRADITKTASNLRSSAVSDARYRLAQSLSDFTRCRSWDLHSVIPKSGRKRRETLGPTFPRSGPSPLVRFERNQFDTIIINDTLMTLGRIRWELAVLALLCVLTIFLFPATQGPYSVVHGPVSALQATRAAARLRVVILQAALQRFAIPIAPPLAEPSGMSYPNPEVRIVNLPDTSAILRC